MFDGISYTDLIPGRYTLSARVMGDGSDTHFISIKNYVDPEQIVNIPYSPYPVWTYIEIRDVPIYTGSCEIGYYSHTQAGSWSSIDDVHFYLQP